MAVNLMQILQFIFFLTKLLENKICTPMLKTINAHTNQSIDLFITALNRLLRLGINIIENKLAIPREIAHRNKLALLSILRALDLWAGLVTHKQ